MVNSILKNMKIVGISTVIPFKELCLLDDKNLYRGDQKKINRVINSSGFLKRRIVDENTTASDLCMKAAEDLIEKLNIDKNTIDGLIFLSYTPDYIMPATSYVLHKKLKLSENCVVMDIPQACSGYILGLFQSGMLLNSNCKRILLLVGDTFSKFSDMFDNNAAPIFGDAGSATIIEYDEKAEPFYFQIESAGENYDSLMCSNGGFRNIPTPVDFYEDGRYKYDAKMDGAKIFNFALGKIAPSINQLLNFASVDKNNINYYVLHQANKFIIENIAQSLNIDMKKVPIETISKYGNQCGASIPCVISDVLQDEVTLKNNKFLFCGFGVGLSWASVILDIKKIYCSGIIEYKEENEKRRFF